jgi:hypothetical protein
MNGSTSVHIKQEPKSPHMPTNKRKQPEPTTPKQTTDKSPQKTPTTPSSKSTTTTTTTHTTHSIEAENLKLKKQLEELVQKYQAQQHEIELLKKATHGSEKLEDATKVYEQFWIQAKTIQELDKFFDENNVADVSPTTWNVKKMRKELADSFLKSLKERFPEYVAGAELYTEERKRKEEQTRQRKRESAKRRKQQEGGQETQQSPAAMSGEVSANEE